MSSTNRGRLRNRQDNYPTDSWCVRRLLEALPLRGGLWIEPAAGNGSIIRAVQAVRDDVVWNAVEIRAAPIKRLQASVPGGKHRVIHVDFFKYGFSYYEVAITNPPFILAPRFVEVCRHVARHTVMLLRLNYYSGAENRVEFLRMNNPDIYVLPNRPSFLRKRFVSKRTGKVTFRRQTDSIEYAWFHWGPKTMGRHFMLADTPLEERRLG